MSDTELKIINLIKSAKTLDESLKVLSKLLSLPIAVDDDGSIYEIKKVVDKIRDMKIEIYSEEHAPPHFHLKDGMLNASFTIKDGKFLNGVTSPRATRLVKLWYINGGRERVIDVWNETRPTNCPVGLVVDND